MLTDSTEIAIISKARQKNVRNPKRSRQHFHNIIEDFFAGVDLQGNYVDLGPGQFDLGEIIRAAGGTCLGVDFDPAVLELGRHKGFDVVDLNLTMLPDHNFSSRFDGVFNKFSLNAFWTPEEEDQRKMVTAISNLSKPQGWSWIAPWNGIPKAGDLTTAQIRSILEFQRTLFEAEGFSTLDLSDADSRRYGVHGTVANSRVFYRNLKHRRSRISWFGR